jgi:hypothetical protein
MAFDLGANSERVVLEINRSAECAHAAKLRGRCAWEVPQPLLSVVTPWLCSRGVPIPGAAGGSWCVWEGRASLEKKARFMSATPNELKTN